MCEKLPGKPRGVLQDDNHAFSKPACCERDTAPGRGTRTRSGVPNSCSCSLLENKPEPCPSPFLPAEQSSPKIGRGRLILEAGRVAPGSVNEEMGPTRSTWAGVSRTRPAAAAPQCCFITRSRRCSQVRQIPSQSFALCVSHLRKLPSELWK